jgi:hypothetical protein
VRKLTVGDILDLRAYEREREGYRAGIIAMKRHRRVALGEIVTVVFENTETMRFQVQEMARAERMVRDDDIAHEVATYNELIPGDGELSATLFIELHTEEQLRRWLPALVGIEDHVALRFTDGTESRAVETDAERLTRADVTPAVHFLRFSPTPSQRAAFDAPGVHLVVDHPAYGADVELDERQRAALAGDLRG